MASAVRSRGWASPASAAWTASIWPATGARGRVFGLGWDGQRWQLEELLQTALQFTAGGYDEDGNVLVVNCVCFYLTDQGPVQNPPGALWRVLPADQVPQGAELARTVQQ
jgi:hypothetical protein